MAALSPSPQSPVRLPLEDVAAGSTPWLRQVAEDLDQVHGFGDAMDVLLDAARRLGFQGVDYSFLPVTRVEGRWVAPAVAYRAFPEGWDRQWHRHSADDPYYHACFEGQPWVEWSEVRARGDLTPRERGAIAYLQDAGVTDGITVPIRLKGNQLAFVTGVQPPAHAPRLAADGLLALAHYFHHFVQHQRLLVHRDWRSDPLLSPRELECLALAARGLTSAASADVLQRSVETVRLHLKHAIRKLGAKNVTEAVAKAMRLDLLET